MSKSSVDTLIVPYCEFVGKNAEKALSEFNGKIIYDDEESRTLKEFIQNYEDREYRLEKYNKDIRVLKRKDKYFIFNEGIVGEKNRLITSDGTVIPFSLSAGESVLLNVKENPVDYTVIEERKLSDKCKVWACNADEKEFKPVNIDSYLTDVNAVSGYERFTGKIRYKLCFTANKTSGKIILDFGALSGGLKVRLNGREFAEMFGVPYTLDITDVIEENNDLEFELSSTLALKYLDKYTKYCKIEKLGLNDDIKLIYQYSLT